MLKAGLCNICLHHYNKEIYITYDSSILFQIYQSTFSFQLYYFIFTDSKNLFHSVPSLTRKTFLFIFWIEPLHKTCVSYMWSLKSVNVLYKNKQFLVPFHGRKLASIIILTTVVSNFTYSSDKQNLYILKNLQTNIYKNKQCTGDT